MRTTVERELVAIWKNDTPDGFYIKMIMFDDRLLDALQQMYNIAMQFLQTDPQNAKPYFIREIEEFAREFNANGRMMPPEKAPLVSEVIIKIAALENLGLIESNDYNGVVGVAFISNQTVH